MGKIYLFGNHHEMNDRKNAVIFQPEMLEWLIERKEPLDPAYIKALTAFQDLGPFDIEFCLYVEPKTKYLNYAHRTWGYIYLGGEYIAGFSHDSRHENCPFRSLYGWPELDNADAVAALTVEQWKQIVINRIIKNVENNLKEAKGNYDEARKIWRAEKTKYETTMQAINQLKE